MRTRRVGSITCGGILILFGVLFMVHMFYPALSLTFIMKLWPVVLIALGIEMIAANLHQRAEDVQVLKYDKGAVVMIILLSCFAMVMGVIEYCMEYYSRYGYIYIS